LQNSLELIDQIVEVADVYYVTGNHEVATNDVPRIKEELTVRGVRVLSNETLKIERAGEVISITGIEDPLMGGVASEMIAASRVPSDVFAVLLAHRPEDFQAYVDAGIDVTFSGHAHGGQFRIPYVGGLVAPGQGYFPKYTAGVHEQGQSKLVVSRGLGNSIIPIRLFNLPEIVVVTLKSS
jgi:predicted MPP superfamily phosphohydrolase